MASDSGRRPAGRDAQQARGEARQSGGAAVSPEPGSPPQATATELLPCRECGLPCRVETFGNTELIAEPFDLFICCNHKRFGGYCPSDLAYFDADAWNTRPNQEATPADRVLHLVEAVVHSIRALNQDIPLDIDLDAHCDAARTALTRIASAVVVQEVTRTVWDGEVVILSSICGKHFDGACQSCRAAKQDNDHRALLTKATRP